MLKDRIIQQISDQLGQLFAGFSPDDANRDGASADNERSELHKSIHAIVQNVFSKLDLVTREQFDAQQDVLRKTERRVAELEEELETISNSLK